VYSNLRQRVITFTRSIVSPPRVCCRRVQFAPPRARIMSTSMALVAVAGPAAEDGDEPIAQIAVASSSEEPAAKRARPGGAAASGTPIRRGWAAAKLCSHAVTEATCLHTSSAPLLQSDSAQVRQLEPLHIRYERTQPWY
jgi:hypothetical protein